MAHRAFTPPIEYGPSNLFAFNYLIRLVTVNSALQTDWEGLARIDVAKSSSHQLSHTEIASDNPWYQHLLSRCLDTGDTRAVSSDPAVSYYSGKPTFLRRFWKRASSCRPSKLGSVFRNTISNECSFAARSSISKADIFSPKPAYTCAMPYGET
jgi:hypothetical protein